MNAAQLKASILQQAIEGKIVPQLPEEGVVEQIGDVPTEVPFEIPESWKWFKFPDLVSFNIGKTPDRSNSSYWDGDIPWVSIADITKSDGYIRNTKELISHCALEDIFSNNLAKAGSLLMSFKLSIGKVAFLTIDAAHNEAIISINPHNGSEDTKKFLFYALPVLVNYAETNNAIKGKTLNKNKINALLIPVPPLTEQKRIVAKIEELMPLVEEYGKAYDKLQELNDELPGKLKASILQEAIQGKLVPQLPEDGVVKQIGNAPEEAPFDIPNSWKWYTLGNLLEYGNCKQVAGKDITSTTWVLDLEDIEKNTGKIIEKKRNVKSTSNKNVFEEGYVLYSKLRPYLNKVVIADETGVCTTEIIPLNVKTAKVPLLPHYLQFCLMSPSFLNYANRCSYGVKMPRLGTNDAKAAYIPVPPLAEQKRIVAKVDTLLEQIDLMTK